MENQHCWPNSCYFLALFVAILFPPPSPHTVSLYFYRYGGPGSALSLHEVLLLQQLALDSYYYIHCLFVLWLVQLLLSGWLLSPVV